MAKRSLLSRCPSYVPFLQSVQISFGAHLVYCSKGTEGIIAVGKENPTSSANSPDVMLSLKIGGAVFHPLTPSCHA